MGGICKRIVPESIILNPASQGKSQEKEDIIRQLVDSLAKRQEVSDAEQLIKDILEREDLASTCLGLGCAVPHAHSSAVTTTVIAAARLDPPLELDAPDGEPVSLMFLLAGPRNSAGLHIKLLSKLSRLLHDSTFREQLRKAGTAEEFYQLLCKKDD